MGVRDIALLGLEETQEQPKGQANAEQVSRPARIHGGVEHMSDSKSCHEQDESDTGWTVPLLDENSG